MAVVDVRWVNLLIDWHVRRPTAAVGMVESGRLKVIFVDWLILIEPCIYCLHFLRGGNACVTGHDLIWDTRHICDGLC